MANENEKKFRVESDLLGELQVPAEAYYGVQTQRAINNYKISGKHMCDYPEYVKAIAYVKLAAAEANHELGQLPDDVADAPAARSSTASFMRTSSPTWCRVVPARRST